MNYRAFVATGWKVSETGFGASATGRSGLKRLVLLTVLAVVISGSAWSQMDMLPQIFRDLPPEIRQGLPAEMSYAEYRALNRNIDFFTMFMGIFVPGYGLFTVERPDLAWPMVGARLAGYGMMGAAVALQWNDFRDIGKGETLSEENYRRLVTNSFLFGGGVVVAGLSWAADIGLAYHIAKEEREFVQYRYGVRATLSSSAREAQATDEAYLRRMLAQPSDEMLDERLSTSLVAHAMGYPESAFAGAALYFAATLRAEQRNDIQALGLALRSTYLYPNGERAGDAVRLVALLLERNPAWRTAFEVADSIATIPRSDGPSPSEAGGMPPGGDTRLLELAMELIYAEIEEFTRLGIEQVETLLVLFPGSSIELQALAVLAEASRQLAANDQAAQYLAMIVLRHPQSELWAPSTLALAELYRDELRDPERAQVLLRAIVEHAPGSREASEAQRLLAQ